MKWKEKSKLGKSGNVRNVRNRKHNITSDFLIMILTSSAVNGFRIWNHRSLKFVVECWSVTGLLARKKLDITDIISELRKKHSYWFSWFSTVHQFWFDFYKQHGSLFFGGFVNEQPIKTREIRFLGISESLIRNGIWITNNKPIRLKQKFNRNCGVAVHDLFRSGYKRNVVINHWKKLI